MYVFQPSGEHVASLSLASSGEHVASLSLPSSGGAKHPAGIAIDDDGFMYVCDCHVGTIIVF